MSTQPGHVAPARHARTMHRSPAHGPTERLVASALVAVTVWHITRMLTDRPLPPLLGALIVTAAHQAFDAPVAAWLAATRERIVVDH